MSEKVVSRKLYLIVFLTLLFLTYLTTQISFFDLGYFNTAASVGIAVTKATLVLLFFMHVKYSESAVRVAVVAGIFWLGVLLLLALSDYLARGVLPILNGYNTPGYPLH
jgi:cytochrome c oxidase subunit IV